MGCTSIVGTEQKRVLPLPQETVNSYIDKFPAIILQKIKQKFQVYADKRTRQLNRFNFLKLYANSQLSQETLQRLYEYFNDHRSDSLKFRRFMMKYAIITKCEPEFLFRIFFQVYKTSFEQEKLSRQQFQNFVESQKSYFDKDPPTPELTIQKQTFVSSVGVAMFNTIEFQKKLIITTEEDVPFKAINRQIQESDFDYLTQGRWYYLLSNSWYSRWSFYYQEVNHTLDKSNIKSTKLLPPLQSGRRKKKRRSINDSTRRGDSISFMKPSEINSSLIQQPSNIDFDDIEGEYRGQLKDRLQTREELRTINQSLWKLLCSLHPPDQEFKRMALDQDTIEYYPRTVYYIEADQNGNYILPSQTIKHLSVTKSIESIYQISEWKIKKDGLGIFTKNFYQKNWRDIKPQKKGAEISLDPRFFVVFALDKDKFIEKHMRKQVSTTNLEPGDKVFAYFPYIKDSSEAVIIGMADNQNYKIHFKGYSYRYELNFAATNLVVDNSEDMLASLKKNNESLVKGLSNIGNTCFMNAVIECLVATPVFDKFLQEFPFDQKKQPIGHALSILAKALLNNEKPTPFFFKKVIDIQMPLFSGYDQHDAQQFLNMLLDNMAEELKEKPTVIDYLFGGKTVSCLTCLGCKKQKKIDQKMFIMSLPIPEADFNYYNLILIPISSSTIKKIIFKLPSSATVGDYVKAFEERTGQYTKDYNFLETVNNSLRQSRSELTTASLQKKRLIDIGLTPNLSIMAFEKMPTKIFYDLLKNKDETFQDFKTPEQQHYWTVCKTVKHKSKGDKTSIEYINQDDELQVTKVSTEDMQGSVAKLGKQTTSDLSYKKVILRKYNSSLKRLEQFGLQFLLGIPKWGSFNDIIAIVEKFLGNLKTRDAKYHKQDDKGDYIIRLRDPSKARCIFCLKDSLSYNIKETQLGQCCTVFDKEVPLGWASKHKKYWIYVDWINISALNAMFYSYIELDPISRNIESSKQEEFINLEDCIKLLNQKEKVEMECDGCKGKYQNLEHMIGGVPNILIVHMKEFRYTSEGHLIKLDLRLKWQQLLDSSKFAMTVNGKLYELYSLVRHSGNSKSGHYTCIAKRKHPFENKRVWINFDDDITEIIDQPPKVVDDPYLLFYRKVDMPTSSLVMYSDLQQQ